MPPKKRTFAAKVTNYFAEASKNFAAEAVTPPKRPATAWASRQGARNTKLNCQPNNILSPSVILPFSNNCIFCPCLSLLYLRSDVIIFAILFNLKRLRSFSKCTSRKCLFGLRHFPFLCFWQNRSCRQQQLGNIKSTWPPEYYASIIIYFRLYGSMWWSLDFWFIKLGSYRVYKLCQIFQLVYLLANYIQLLSYCCPLESGHFGKCTLISSGN